MMDYQNSILKYKKEFEINPNKYETYNNLGCIYYFINDYKNIIINLKRTIEIN